MKFPQFDVYRAARRAEAGVISIVEGSRDMSRAAVQSLMMYATIGRYLALRNPKEAERLYREALAAQDYELRHAQALVGTTVRCRPWSQCAEVVHQGRLSRATRIAGSETLAFAVDGRGGMVAEIEPVE